jgi:hypothetical protein
MLDFNSLYPSIIQVHAAGGWADTSRAGRMAVMQDVPGGSRMHLRHDASVLVTASYDWHRFIASWDGCNRRILLLLFMAG